MALSLRKYGQFVASHAAAAYLGGPILMMVSFAALRIGYLTDVEFWLAVFVFGSFVDIPLLTSIPAIFGGIFGLASLAFEEGRPTLELPEARLFFQRQYQLKSLGALLLTLTAFSLLFVGYVGFGPS